MQRRQQNEKTTKYSHCHHNRRHSNPIRIRSCSHSFFIDFSLVRARTREISTWPNDACRHAIISIASRHVSRAVFSSALLWLWLQSNSCVLSMHCERSRLFYFAIHLLESTFLAEAGTRSDVEQTGVVWAVCSVCVYRDDIYFDDKRWNFSMNHLANLSTRYKCVT